MPGVVEGFFTTGEWLLQGKANQEFDSKEHVDHNSNKLEDDAAYDARER